MSLLQTFAAAWSGVGASAPAEPVFTALSAAYGAPERHYHTLAHVTRCLAWLDWASALAVHRHEVALALWFHDAVYVPSARDNERQSAAWARHALGTAGVSADAVARIEQAILATASHAPGHGDVALLCDIDLAILGAEPDEFAAFEAAVRAEFAALDDTHYAQGRARVLAGFLARPAIYATALLHAELEVRARHNLAAALRRWSRAG
jgi:predicted metal-dependent HD superfamily phosphohydrolase